MDLEWICLHPGESAVDMHGSGWIWVDLSGSEVDPGGSGVDLGVNVDGSGWI